MKRKNRVFMLSFAITTVVSVSQINSTRVDAKTQTFSIEVSEDSYQKSISRGFLGSSYGIGAGRYVCNTFVEKALENVSNVKLNTTGTAFKNVQVTTATRKKKASAPTSYDWKDYNVRITYTASTYDAKTGTYHWNTKTTVTTLNKKNRGTSLNKLTLGDVLTYGVNGGHVALYFGEYESKEEVFERLVDLGVYKESDLKKMKDRYVNKKGKTIIREYPNAGQHWRIHATNKGLMIDNAIVSKSSNGTSSFGKWTKTIPSGFVITDQISKK